MHSSTITRIVPATLEHARLMAPDIRREELAETMTLSGRDALAEIGHSLALSIGAWCWLYRGEPAMMWGFGKQPSLPAVIWSLTTELVLEHRAESIEAARYMIGRCLQASPVLEMWSDVQDTLGADYLQEIGFHQVGGVLGAVRVPGLTLIHFQICRDDLRSPRSNA